VRTGTRAGLACTVSSEQEAPDAAGVLDAGIERLAHELAEAINTAGVDGRAGLRDSAVSILREEVDITAPPVTAAGGATPGPFNPFGIGIPLFLMGTVLVFLFPPVGLFLFALAALVVAWGVGATLLARS